MKIFIQIRTIKIHTKRERSISALQKHIKPSLKTPVGKQITFFRGVSEEQVQMLSITMEISIRQQLRLDSPNIGFSIAFKQTRKR